MDLGDLNLGHNAAACRVHFPRDNPAVTWPGTDTRRPAAGPQVLQRHPHPPPAFAKSLETRLPQLLPRDRAGWRFARRRCPDKHIIMNIGYYIFIIICLSATHGKGKPDRAYMYYTYRLQAWTRSSQYLYPCTCITVHGYKYWELLVQACRRLGLGKPLLAGGQWRSWTHLHSTGTWVLSPPQRARV